MDTPITRAEHNEFCKRMEEENKRQDKRLENLERTTEQIGELTASVGSLAQSIESMVKEQEKQGERLEVLEGRDGEMWRKVTSYIITIVVGAVIGFVLTRLGLR